MITFSRLGRQPGWILDGLDGIVEQVDQHLAKAFAIKRQLPAELISRRSVMLAGNACSSSVAASRQSRRRRPCALDLARAREVEQVGDDDVAASDVALDPIDDLVGAGCPTVANAFAQRNSELRITPSGLRSSWLTVPASWPRGRRALPRQFGNRVLQTLDHGMKCSDQFIDFVAGPSLVADFGCHRRCEGRRRADGGSAGRCASTPADRPAWPRHSDNPNP